MTVIILSYKIFTGTTRTYNEINAFVRTRAFTQYDSLHMYIVTLYKCEAYSQYLTKRFPFNNYEIEITSSIFTLMNRFWLPSP